ncbi:PEP-CTERM sorting domain-containing protein [Methyloversatilis thermotolerans]|uniref:PEP-CTERM sorting domain-containing protein n=1 Tax=Methyloversatilis thermotolerans TaxID=1346290 RepID=UPI00037A01CF|nr:PEP-CTERM sorting domain-containing protein [Methyloversatilis thermotolerans]
MKLASSIAVLAFGALTTHTAQAGTFNLSLSADEGSRFYDYFSDVYGELGKDWGIIENEDSEDYGLMADGSFLIGTSEVVGSGAIYFPNLGNFLNVGTITYDDATGVITGVSMPDNAFSRYIADNDGHAANTFGAYRTIESTSFSGSVTLAGGAVTGIDLVLPISFRYGSYSYDGSFVIDGDSFELFVDDSNQVGPYTFRYAWDVTGSVQNLAPVPEPESYALMLAGLGLLAGVARRAKRA